MERAPFPWYGGKSYIAKAIASLFPRHHTYVEVFGGAASVLFAKRPSPVEVYNDIDSGIVNFFRVLRDPDKADRLQTLLYLTPWSREEFYRCRDEWQLQDDPIERARMWFVVACQSFSGTFGESWSFSVSSSSRGMVEQCSKWLSRIDLLPYFCARLQMVQIENRDFRELVPMYDTADTLFYLDPPYVQSTRTAHNDGYVHDMYDDDHADLVELLLSVKGMCVLSGYQNDLYAPLEESGWTRIELPQHLRSAKKRLGDSRDMRTECVWLSPNTTSRRPRQLKFV